MRGMVFLGLFLGFLAPVWGQNETQAPIIKKELRVELVEGQVVQPPFNGIPFCAGRLKVTNNLGTDITRLQLNLAYNGVQLPVSFGQIPYKGSVMQKFAMAGSACEGMTKPPKITVPICNLADKTVGGCSSFLTYFIGQKKDEV